jgi:hypothetical protein
VGSFYEILVLMAIKLVGDDMYSCLI